MRILKKGTVPWPKSPGFAKANSKTTLILSQLELRSIQGLPLTYADMEMWFHVQAPPCAFIYVLLSFVCVCFVFLKYETNLEFDSWVIRMRELKITWNRVSWFFLVLFFSVIIAFCFNDQKRLSFCVWGTNGWSHYFRLDVSFLVALYFKSVISEYCFTLNIVCVSLSLVFGLLSRTFHFLWSMAGNSSYLFQIYFNYFQAGMQ